MSKDSYQTPREVFEALHAEFNFQLDAAASHTNALLPFYITEEQNTLETEWRYNSCADQDAGWYAWMNPPYSNISPFVARAAEMAKQGIGTVMLVMMDQSVGWYKEAVKTCQEVRLVIGGRLSFINPVTGKPAAGNNKGSMFLIWHPFGRTAVQYSHIDRDEMLAAGRELLNQAEQPLDMVKPNEMVGSLISEGTNPVTLEFTRNELETQIELGQLPFGGDALDLILQLESMFGKKTKFTSKQVKAAVIAFDEPGIVSKASIAEQGVTA